MRAVQNDGKPADKGSLKWIQRAIAEDWSDLREPLRTWLGGATVTWDSPIAKDEYAEYRDAAFLDCVGLGRLASALQDFWPERGPQWDALGKSDAEHVILVEAKAHIREFRSPFSKATSEESLTRIKQSLNETSLALGVAQSHLHNWNQHFYQYVNRLAHLHWLRNNKVDAKLALVSFVHDDEMPGRTTRESWDAAYLMANYVLGLKAGHPLAQHIIHLHPDVDGRG